MIQPSYSPTPRPSRVLMTTDTVSAAWSYSLELARALKRRGVDVVLASMGRSLSPQQRETTRRASIEVFESAFKLEWMEDPWDDLRRAGDWLLRLEDWVRPDLVQLSNFVHGALPWRAPAAVAGHSCVLSWWRAVRGEEAPAEWEWYRCEATRGLRAADLVVAPTQWALERLQEYYGPLRLARAVPNGRDASEYTPAKKRAFVLGAGRFWDEAQNLRILDEVAGRLSWPVLVAGELDHPEGGTADSWHIRPLGHLSPGALAGWLGHASIFASTATYDPFGYSVLEAALAGCALVLSDIPSFRELWDDAAVLVPANDAGVVREALEHLIRDAQCREELAARAQRRAGHYTSDAMAEGYLASYADVMALRS